MKQWDTAGLERYRNVTGSFYKYSIGTIFVYDTINRASFETMEDWISQARKSSEKYCYILIGNKVDIVGNLEINEFNGKRKLQIIITGYKIIS